MNAAEQIILIDQQIDANRRVMFNRLHVPPTISAHAWQNAWDRCPDLYAREQELYRQRGELQVHRDEAEHKAWQSEQRKQRAATKRNHSHAAKLGNRPAHPTVLWPELNGLRVSVPAVGQIPPR